jgi:hypothetical protein
MIQRDAIDADDQVEILDEYIYLQEDVHSCVFTSDFQSCIPLNGLLSWGLLNVRFTRTPVERSLHSNSSFIFV